MPPALFFFNENHADGFAEAARRSKRLHGRWVHPPTDPKAVKELARKRKGPSDFCYVIHDFNSGAVAGYIEVTNIVRGPFLSAYLGFYMFSGYERQGYMKWALGAIVKRAWKELELHRLEAKIQPENAASIILTQSLGFKSSI